MIPHVLACTDYGWSCGHTNTVSGLFLALCGIGLALGIAISAALGAKWTKR